MSAVRGKLTNCCTRNDAGGATQVHSAHKHTHTHIRIHTKELFLPLPLAHFAFSNLIFRLTAHCKSFYWSFSVAYTRFFHCPFHLICTTRAVHRVWLSKCKIGNMPLLRLSTPTNDIHIIYQHLIWNNSKGSQVCSTDLDHIPSGIIGNRLSFFISRLILSYTCLKDLFSIYAGGKSAFQIIKLARYQNTYCTQIC